VIVLTEPGQSGILNNIYDIVSMYWSYEPSLSTPVWQVARVVVFCGFIVLMLTGNYQFCGMSHPIFFPQQYLSACYAFVRYLERFKCQCLTN
jgi:hypothetical protein